MLVVGEAWLSLVERCVRDAEAAGSNPVTPIILILVIKDEEVCLCRYSRLLLKIILYVSIRQEVSHEYF